MRRYEHFWNPRWRTSLYGGYTEVNTTTRPTPSSAPCKATRQRQWRWHFRRPGKRGLRQQLEAWWIGSRTQWNVTKDFYMGLDVAYRKCRA